MTVMLSPSQRIAPNPLLTGYEWVHAARPYVGGLEAEPALRSLDQFGREVRFRRNETVFAEGEDSAHVYRVVRGATRSFRTLMDGRRHIAAFGLPGDFLALDGQPEHDLSAEAITDLVVISYPRSQFERLMDDEPALRKRIMRMLVDDMVENHSRLVMLGRQTAIERLAWFLVRKAKRLDQGGGVFELPMPRHDIADYLGLTIETVSRLITQLKRKRLISLPDAHHIKVVDFTGLQDLAAAEVAGVA